MAEADAPTTEQTPADLGGGADKAPSLLDADVLYKSTEAAPEPDKGEVVESDGEGEADTEAGHDATPGASEAASDEGSEEDTISSINAWIEQLAADPEKVSQLKVPVKVNGETAMATLSDLVKSYQIGEAAEQRLEEAKAKAKSLTDDLTRQQQAVQGNLTVVAKLIEQAEKMIDADAGAINWNQLRQDDPAEYSAKKEEIRERRQQLDKLKADAVQSYQQAAEAQQKEAAENLKAVREQEKSSLLEAMPELKDAAAWKTFGDGIMEYARALGFTEYDVKSVLDHRVLILADKARRWDELQASKGRVLKEKKQVKPPKIMKPGARPETQPKQQPKSAEQILYG